MGLLGLKSPGPEATLPRSRTDRRPDNDGIIGDEFRICGRRLTAGLEKAALDAYSVIAEPARIRDRIFQGIPGIPRPVYRSKGFRMVP